MNDLNIRLFVYANGELQYEAWGNTLETFRHELPRITESAAIVGYREQAVPIGEDGHGTMRYVSHIILDTQPKPDVPATGMKPFHGDRRCPKCGYKDAKARHWPASKGPTSLTEYHGGKPERITRTCGRCRYEWDEAVLDLPPAPPQEP